MFSKIPMYYNLFGHKGKILQRNKNPPKSENNKYWEGMWKNWETWALLVGTNVKWYSHHVKQYWLSCKELNVELSYDPGILLLSIHSK